MPYVLGAYRIHHSRLRDCFKSVFRVHNESVNIWSHLVGLFYFVLLGCFFLFYDTTLMEVMRDLRPHTVSTTSLPRTTYPGQLLLVSPGPPPTPLSSLPPLFATASEPPFIDINSSIMAPDSIGAFYPPPPPSMMSLCTPEGYRSIFGLIIASGLCMLWSAIFHTCNCASSDSCRTTCLQFDIAGITLLIVASFRCGVYFGFPQNRFYQTLYLGQSYMLGSILLPFPFLTAVSNPTVWRYLPSVFTISTLTGFVPAFHCMASAPITHLWQFGRPLLSMALLYTIGIFFYLSKFPEKWRPGNFDLWGHSHQWWHFCVFAAAAVWVEGCVSMYSHDCHQRATALSGFQTTTERQ